jgi:hypothetical protein
MLTTAPLPDKAVSPAAVQSPAEPGGEAESVSHHPIAASN